MYSDLQEYFPMLLTNPLFEGISESQLPLVLQTLESYTKGYAKESFVKNSGEAADFIAIVLSGEVYLCQNDYYGNRTIIASLTTGSLFGEAFVCSGIPTLPMDIWAASDCHILFLQSPLIPHRCDGKCDFYHRLITNLLGIVARKNLYLNQKLSYASKRTTREKLLAYLFDQAQKNHSNQFMIPFNRQGLADFLGVERSAMSAELGKLVKEGILETKKNRFRLLGDSGDNGDRSI